ncbi:MAG: hypothetical protein ACT4PU_06010 [Planctomycetota bacterium]
MHRRPSLTQREGLFSTTRYILYGNKVRVIRQSPLERDDQYIPLAAVDPDALVVRQPSPRMLILAGLLTLPGAVAAAGWPAPLPVGLATCAAGLSLLGLLTLGAKGWPGRRYVRHGALQLLVDAPDATRFRTFEQHLVDASRQQLVEGDPVSEPVSVASEIRRLHEHCTVGHLPPETFGRHKQRLIQSIRDYLT